MSKIDLTRIIEELNKNILSKSGLASHYKHPSGIGEEKERIIINILKK